MYGQCIDSRCNYVYTESKYERDHYMVKKLTKHGNSLAVLLDKPILEMLNINEKTPLRIKTDGVNIIIEPIHELSTMNEDKIKELYEELVEKYDVVLKKLSEN